LDVARKLCDVFWGGSAMQLTPNRRVNRSERFPTRIAVELGQGDLREAFEADVLDFTRAGVSMRAPYLPEIGTQLACRFRCMPSGSTVAARGEVVWAQLDGDDSGEFGLAFVDLDARTEWLIEEMLAEPITKRRDEPGDPAELIAQLELEGSTEPIAARIAARETGRAVFEQHLDLLSLGRGVRAHAPGASDRNGSIAGVELRMVGNVPMLAVTVNFEGDTQSGGVDAALAQLNLPHDTVTDLNAPNFADDDALDEGAMKSITLTEFRIAERGAARRGVSAKRATPESRERDCPTEFVIETEIDETAPIDIDALAGPSWKNALRDRGQAAWLELGGRLQAVRGAVDARLGQLQLHFEQHQGRLGVALRELYHKELGTRVGAVRRLARRRRTTADPGVVRRPALPLSPAVIALCVAAALAAFAGVYALASSGAEHEVTPLSEALPAEDAQADDQLAVDTAALDALAEVGSATGRPLPTARRVVSSAPAAEERVGATAEGVPASSPFAVDVGAEPQARQRPSAPSTAPRFGAAKVPRAKRFPLRLNAPAQSLRGVADAGGFTVKVLGAQSLDRAGPLRSAHRAVASAMILNKGDHAELTVRFVQGKRPAYQVIAEGDVLYVVLQEL
jgi:hypothetical protein